MKPSLKQRVHLILGRPNGGPLNTAFNISLITLIILNAISIGLETVSAIKEQYGSILYAFEVFSVGVFTLEYILRLWTCSADPKYGSGIKARLRFAKSPMAVIDILAILPFYLPLFVTLDLRMLRLMRMFRLFRLLKLGRYSLAVRNLLLVFKVKAPELATAALVGVILMIITSTLMYFVEHEAQPEAFSSIPATMWWAVATLTTVGYGDVYPVTVIGKFLGACVACMGIGVFALPAGILATGLSEIMRSEEKFVCQKCKSIVKAIEEEEEAKEKNKVA